MVELAVTDLRTTTAELGGSTYVLAVTGRLDPSSSRSLAGELDRVLARGASRVAIDVSGISVVDPPALEPLVERARTLAARGGELVLVVDVALRLLLEHRGIDSSLRIERSLAEAIDRFVSDPVVDAS